MSRFGRRAAFAPTPRWARFTACLIALLLVLMAAATVTQAQLAADEALVDPLSPEQRAWLATHGPIRYAPDPDYPPFEFFNDKGEVEGINVDFLNRMSRNLDVEFEVVRYENWSLVLEGMKAGEVDLLGSLAQTEERETYMDFHGPYMQVGEVYYVADPELVGKDDSALVGKQVGVIKDYAASTWLRENRPELTLVEVGGMEEGLQKLSVGELDAFFENIPVGGYVIRDNALNNIQIMGEPLYYSPANWGVPEGDAMMLSIIEAGMASIPLGERTKIFEYWTGYDLGLPAQDATGFSPLARNTLFVVLGVTFVTATWGFALRKTVRAQTRDLRDASEGLAKANQRLARDNERRRVAEAQVRQLNDELEERIEERTRQLLESNADLEAFTTSVAHDLRQPLTRLANLAFIVERRAPDDPEEAASHAASLREQVAEMQRLIEDMHALSRMSGVLGEHGRIDISAESETVWARLAEGEPDRAVDVQVEPGLQVEAGIGLVRVVLMNVIENAWKYTRGKRVGRIRVGALPDADVPTFFVEDNGVGFDPADAERVFEPFVRLRNAEDFEGSGIGMATVRRVLRRQGGDIWAEIGSMGGARFVFRFESLASELDGAGDEAADESEVFVEAAYTPS